jgi:prepilin-type processing-associated H-X9-DG protein
MMTSKDYINNPLPADRHSHGCNLSFADRHVEHWIRKNRKNSVSMYNKTEN